MGIAIILSSLALLAATASLALTLRERKRSQERNTALMQYMECLEKDLQADSKKACDEACAALEKRLNHRIGALEKGIVPDFEKAKAAANAVNDFNAGLASIMGFDPMEALKQQRDGATGGDRL